MDYKIPSINFIDIGANLLDPMYSGIYHQHFKHEPDLERVLDRSWNNGVQQIIVTCGNHLETQQALQLCQSHQSSRPRLFCTAGVHPTRCNEMVDNPDEYLSNLLKLINNDQQSNPSYIVAFGEFGLDFERTQFCDLSTQLIMFDKLLFVASTLSLPLFLHCRSGTNCHLDASIELYNRLKVYPHLCQRSVVHSFDGTLDELNRFLSLGCHIGINGCSLKKTENIEVIKNIPIKKLHLETDSPWCEIRKSHASYSLIDPNFIEQTVKNDKYQKNPKCLVKNRNEPCNIIQIASIISNIYQIPINELAMKTYNNSNQLFFTK